MRREIGARSNENVAFCVWAPEAKNVELKLISNNQLYPLQKDKRGYWRLATTEARPGDLYVYRLDGEKEYPDPASAFQPKDVHGPSAIVDHRHFLWTDLNWKGMELKDMIIYELHVGTFSPEGTFEGVINKLDYLEDLGITAIELMPLGQFPGNRNWGYDGVFPFAVQHSYGGPEGLKKLVDACHQKGLAVIVDAIYNHLGPEGNYLEKFGPYTTQKYHVPWGNAINFDDAYSDEVRNYFIQNALMWFCDYHVDALRLDAVHAYKDLGAIHFLQELKSEVNELEKETGRRHVLIGECDLNDPKFITPLEEGGYGLDGQWCDEFHHALHCLLTGETNGYYSDFGEMDHMRKAFETSYVYTGEYSEERKKTFGSSPDGHPYSQFVVFGQNHDQIGNRLLGDRISTCVSFEALKLMAGATLISPSVPLLFMGEEFGEENPFQYFVSPTDKELIETIREGRKKEFEHFHSEGEAPDPASEETFEKSKLNWDLLKDPQKQALRRFYQFLIRLRKTHPAFRDHDRNTLKTQLEDEKRILKVERHFSSSGTSSLYAVMNFDQEDSAFSLNVGGDWQLCLDSSDLQWNGQGSVAPKYAKMGDVVPIKAQSIIIYTK